MNIVVLDDSKTVLLTIHALLEELGVADECISLFSNGYKALAYIEEHGADIIFSDINMPDMDGFEFVGRLFELSQRFVSVLFIVSADEHCGDITHMKNIGAKRFLRKPINPKHFNHFVAHEVARVSNRHRREPFFLTPNESKKVDEVLTVPALGNIDYEALAHKMGIKVKHIPRLIESFLSEAKALSEKLYALHVTREYAEIEKYAHSLKGSAGNMQFLALYERAKEMELSAKNRDEKFDYENCCSWIKQEVSLLSSQF